jgi:hypothetical protein
MKLCSVDDCSRPHVARGLCKTHYNRLKREKPVDKEIWAEDFWQFVREELKLGI